MCEYDRDHAGRIIGAAAKDADAASERLTQAEVEDAAEGVGIPREAVRGVIAREDEAEHLASERRIARSLATRDASRVAARGMAWVTYTALLLVFVYVVAVGRASSVLANDHTHVVAARQTVELAQENLRTLPASLATAQNDGERATVIERANRRVYVAKRDYDAAVLTYNAGTTGWVARRALRRLSLPATEPYAHDVWRIR